MSNEYLAPQDAGKLQQENLRLRRAVDELTVLNEIATTINSTMNLDSIIGLMVKKCVKHLNVEQAAVSLLDAGNAENSNPLQTMVRQADTSNPVLPYRLDAQLTGWVLKNSKPLLVNDLANDDRFGRLASADAPQFRSLLSVPLLSRGEIRGVISVFNKKSGDFTAEDQRLLSIIAAQSTQVIDNARLLEEQQALIRVREEMRLARDIQIKLLPQSAPAFPGFDIAGKAIPAKEVGGDCYDFIPLDNDRLLFSIGDITGKGLPAAMLMANTQATIRSLALGFPEPAECIRLANRLVHASTDSGKFVTMFLGVLDKRKKTLTYCNAGHDAPFLQRADGTVVQLQTGGIVLGFLGNFVFQQEVIELTFGDKLVITTDGITEAMNANDEEFGEDQLVDLLAKNYALDSLQTIETVFSTVNAHANGTPQSDDMTMIVIRMM